MKHRPLLQLLFIYIHWVQSRNELNKFQNCINMCVYVHRLETFFHTLFHIYLYNVCELFIQIINYFNPRQSVVDPVRLFYCLNVFIFVTFGRIINSQNKDSYITGKFLWIKKWRKKLQDLRFYWITLRHKFNMRTLQEINNNVAHFEIWLIQMEPNLVGMLIWWTSTMFICVSQNFNLTLRAK